MAFEMNLNGLRKKIASMQEMAGHAALDMVNELSGIGEAQAKALAPVDSGELRASIHMTPAKIEDGEAIGGWRTNNDHAVYQEYGTGQKGMGGLVSNGQAKDPDPDVSYRQDWGGIPAQPFMYPASQLVAEIMPETLKKYGQKIVGV